MTPELQQRLGAVLDYIGDVAKGATDFTAEQAPLVAREVVMWGVWSNTILAVGLFLAVVPLLLLAKKSGKACKTLIDENSEMCVPVGVATAILIGGAVACTCVAAFSATPKAIKASVAPRLYLVEWVKEAAK